MRRTLEVSLIVVAFTLLTFAQNDVRTFRTETTNAFVWGEDTRPGGVSSSIRDPVTGHEIHKLNHAGVEVSSQAGFERLGSWEAGKLMNVATTIVNTTQSAVSVRLGGASVEGHALFPLSVVLTKKGLKKRERKEAWELASMHCFSSGFIPKEEFFSPIASSTAFTVNPNHALTVSFVTLDPRYSSVLCSVEGCYPKGTMRFAVTVNATEFVFIWPGRTMFYCGA